MEARETVRMLGLGHRVVCPNGHNSSAQLFTVVSFNSLIVGPWEEGTALGRDWAWAFLAGPESRGLD